VEQRRAAQGTYPGHRERGCIEVGESGRRYIHLILLICREGGKTGKK